MKPSFEAARFLSKKKKISLQESRGRESGKNRVGYATVVHGVIPHAIVIGYKKIWTICKKYRSLWVGDVTAAEW